MTTITPSPQTWEATYLDRYWGRPTPENAFFAAGLSALYSITRNRNPAELARIIAYPRRFVGAVLVYLSTLPDWPEAREDLVHYTARPIDEGRLNSTLQWAIESLWELASVELEAIWAEETGYVDPDA